MGNDWQLSAVKRPVGVESTPDGIVTSLYNGDSNVPNDVPFLYRFHRFEVGRGIHSLDIEVFVKTSMTDIYIDDFFTAKLDYIKR